LSKRKIITASVISAGLFFAIILSFINQKKVIAAPAPVCAEVIIDGSEKGSKCSIGLSAISPFDDAVGVSTTATLSFTTNDAGVTASSGNLYIMNSDGSTYSTVACSSLTQVGSTFSTPMSLVLGDPYYINMDMFCLSSGITISDSTTWNFSTASKPNLTSSTPADGSSNNCYTQGLTLNFDQPVFGDTNAMGGNFSVTCGGSSLMTESCGPGTFSGSGTSTLTKNIVYDQASSCTVSIDSTCIHNSSDIYADAINLTFSTNNTACGGGACANPTLDSPDDSVNVRIDKNHSATFDTTWYIDTYVVGQVGIYYDTGVLYQAYDLDDPEISGVGTTTLIIDPAVDLPPSTAMNIQLTGVPRVGCPPYVIADQVTWNFTTAGASLINLIEKKPRTNRLNVNIDPYLELTFDNPVFRGSGSLRVYRTSDEALIDTIPAASARIYGIGTNVARIFPVNGLVYQTDYYVVVDEGFLNGGTPAEPSPYISKDDWYFRTKRSNEEPFWRDWI
jgi:hypothetical protein